MVQLVGGGHALWVIVQRLLPLTRWTVAVPVLGAIIFAVMWGYQPPTAVLVMVGLLLAVCVFAAVHHAEVVAHRVGEPFGALILAVAVTVIEVGLIVMLMVSGGPDTSTLARDTVFAAAMITCNGIVGLALLVGSLPSSASLTAAADAAGPCTAAVPIEVLTPVSSSRIVRGSVRRRRRGLCARSQGIHRADTRPHRALWR
ncbi:Ca2+/H+ antiporter [Mycobacterium sp. URHB0021]